MKFAKSSNDILCVDETKLDDSFLIVNLKLMDASFLFLERIETIKEEEKLFL